MVNHGEKSNLSIMEQDSVLSRLSTSTAMLGIATTVNVFTGLYNTQDPKFNLPHLMLAQEIVLGASFLFANGFEMASKRDRRYAYRHGTFQIFISFLMTVALLTVGAMSGNIWARIGHEDDFLRVTTNGTRVTGADAGIFKTLVVFEILLAFGWLTFAFEGIRAKRV